VHFFIGSHEKQAAITQFVLTVTYLNTVDEFPEYCK